jgi:hypothetical protein
MTATAVDRLATVHFQDDRLSRGLPAASTTLYAGAMIAVNTSGYIVNAAATSTLKVLGTADEHCVSGTTAGQDVDGNALEVRIRRGVQGPFANSSSSDEITDAHRGQYCYCVDNQTVALTSNSGARPVAGIVFRVTTDGVYVEFAGLAMDPSLVEETGLAAHIADTTAAHAATAIAFTPAGTIAASTVQAAVEEVATDAATATALMIPIATGTTAGDIMYFNGTAWVRLAAGTNGQTLKMNAGATAPEWVTV